MDDSFLPHRLEIVLQTLKVDHIETKSVFLARKCLNRLIFFTNIRPVTPEVAGSSPVSLAITSST